MTKQGQHLIHFIHTKGLLPLFQLTDKPESNSSSVGQFILRQPKALATLFDKTN